MLAKVLSAVNIGLDSQLVEAEVDISNGFPMFEIVGLPDKAVSEAKERVRSAIINSGFKFLPGNKKRVVVNLAPADVKKEGSIYDLPIALGLLVASNQINLPAQILDSLFVGELSLNGELRYAKGVLPMAILASQHQIKNIYLPEANAKEAALVEGLNIYPLKSLNQLIAHFSSENKIIPFIPKRNWLTDLSEPDYQYDFAYIKGQQLAKRALEIAVAGGHNVLMIGSPGSGKTLMARSIPSILPLLNREEILEVTKIYSVAGLLKQNEYFKSRRPFRSPHHTISDVAMVGGGQIPHPGEVSLAHHGVLFLDELPYFNRSTLESLRQPLEDAVISVSRARGAITYPAKFILIAAMNPCPCGYYGDPEIECKCSVGEIIRYRKKISGPFLDRIDLHLNIPRVKVDKLMNEKVAESSSEIRKRVMAARNIQKKRFSAQDGSALSRKKLKIITNSEMSPRQINNFCHLDLAGEKLLKEAMEKFVFSARTYHRILKVSRTIADLAGSDKIKVSHLAEAIQYRVKIGEF